MIAGHRDNVAISSGLAIISNRCIPSASKSATGISGTIFLLMVKDSESTNYQSSEDEHQLGRHVKAKVDGLRYVWRANASQVGQTSWK